MTFQSAVQNVQNSLFTDLPLKARDCFPGVAVSITVAGTALLLSEHHGVPAMLMALLIGILLNFFGTEGVTAPGIQYASKSLLRIGVALLGCRVSLQMVNQLGWDFVLVILAAVVCTILFGLIVARFFGHKWRFALLTSGSVAICGASAAMAIAAILPKDARSEERLSFTVMGITLMSTTAMIVYPVIATHLGLDDQMTGFFLGASIHDVAQVTGAGFSMSQEVGDTAVMVKLIRVSMLAPIVFIASLLIRIFAKAPEGDSMPPLAPAFVVGFLVLATLNSVGVIPAALVDWLSGLARYLLLIAISAVGMKTNFSQIRNVGGLAIGLMLAETGFLALFVLGGIWVLM